MQPVQALHWIEKYCSVFPRLRTSGTDPDPPCLCRHTDRSTRHLLYSKDKVDTSAITVSWLKAKRSSSFSPSSSLEQWGLSSYPEASTWPRMPGMGSCLLGQRRAGSMKQGVGWCVRKGKGLPVTPPLLKPRAATPWLMALGLTFPIHTG